MPSTLSAKTPIRAACFSARAMCWPPLRGQQISFVRGATNARTLRGWYTQGAEFGNSYSYAFIMFTKASRFTMMACEFRDNAELCV